MFALRPRPTPSHQRNAVHGRSVPHTPSSTPRSSYDHPTHAFMTAKQDGLFATGDGTRDVEFDLRTPSFKGQNHSYLPNSLPSPSTYSCPLRRAMLLSGVLEEIHPVDEPDPHSTLTFTRRHVPLISRSRSPDESGLTTLLKSPSAPIVNPFSHLLSKGPAPSGEMNIRVYFPHAEYPEGKYLELKVEMEAEVDKVIALALWTYWEQAWLPPLLVNHGDDLNLPKASTVSAVNNPSRNELHRVISSWSLRIVRDGFLDYETEAPDATDKIKFLDSEEYALVQESDSASDSVANEGLPGSTFQSSAQSKPLKTPRLPRRYSNPVPSSGSIKERLSHVRGLSLPLRRGSMITAPESSIPSRPLDRISGYDSRRMRSFNILFHWVSEAQEVQPLKIVASLNDTIKDLLHSTCKERGIKHPGKYSLATLDVRKCYQTIPLEWDVSKFRTDTNFTLVKL
ncbi:hypothetical protein K435DRAFT_971137 [Dendrothele bispora CBS 962.96]|uniref:CRIM domain-containing protein n=1 Tax=Dendrothele bispora (strain CBS 962.96) TaxID=1314807 RepID=A0A4S8L7I0_DENBC|nr:hypothetical protein K435DRAFT_971137 [Dendrothele bispora CBS 962.96]